MFSWTYTYSSKSFLLIKKNYEIDLCGFLHKLYKRYRSYVGPQLQQPSKTCLAILISDGSLYK